MKTGKYVPFGYYKNIKLGYGTVDHKNLKTIYIKFNTWLLPEIDEDYNHIISKTRRSIKNYIYEFKNSYFKKECIVDLDIRTKGIKIEKKSFMNLEITLFVENQIDIKLLKLTVKKLSESLVDLTLTDKNLFNFYQNKK